MAGQVTEIVLLTTEEGECVLPDNGSPVPFVCENTELIAPPNLVPPPTYEETMQGLGYLDLRPFAYESCGRESTCVSLPRREFGPDPLFVNEMVTLSFYLRGSVRVSL